MNGWLKEVITSTTQKLTENAAKLTEITTELTDKLMKPLEQQNKAFIDEKRQSIEPREYGGIQMELKEKGLIISY